MEIADTQFILDLRRRMQANKDAGRPEGDGISREDLKRMLSVLRQNRTTIAIKSAGSSPKAKKEVKTFSDDELNSLFS